MEALPVTTIDHAAVPVRDLDASIDFYCATLGAQVVRPPYRLCGEAAVQQFAVGDAALSLHRWGNGMDLVAGATRPGVLDICFRWGASIHAAIAHVAECGVAIVEGPVGRITCDGRSAQSIYFRDPDGNLIELMAADG